MKLAEAHRPGSFVYKSVSNKLKRRSQNKVKDHGVCVFHTNTQIYRYIYMNTHTSHTLMNTHTLTHTHAINPHISYTHLKKVQSD